MNGTHARLSFFTLVLALHGLFERPRRQINRSTRLHLPPNTLNAVAQVPTTVQGHTCGSERLACGAGSGTGPKSDRCCHCCVDAVDAARQLIGGNVVNARRWGPFRSILDSPLSSSSTQLEKEEKCVMFVLFTPIARDTLDAPS